MKVLYLGHPPTYELYKQKKVPSHWLYGAVEMEKDGHEVIWEWEQKHVWRNILYDIKLVWKNKPDVVFIPTMNVRNHFVLLLLTTLGIQRRRIVAFVHHGPRTNNKLINDVYRLLYSRVSHFFFLSEQTMEEIVKKKIINSQKCSVPGWGPDMDFYKGYKTTDGNYFVSTGKENRDYKLLIDVFRKTGSPLKIMTARRHARNDYTWMENCCKDIPNIEVIFTDNSGDVYPQMLALMANAKALVCPLQIDKINYCVGLSTIADAEGLYKPLIITRNPYHSKDRVNDFNIVETIDEWVEALNHLKQPMHTKYNMKRCWENMLEKITLVGKKE